jgi:TP901 family phage tail tape measure protein
VADRSVSLTLGVNLSNFRSQMAAAKSSVTDFAQTADKKFRDNSASVDTLSNSAGVAGAALLGLAGLAVKRFADFDKAMSSVKASTRATGAELESLRAVAIKAGADTAFSASEAAAGIDELAKAGVATKDILGGGLAGALNLAAAGQISVAEAAETAASAMVQFNLKGSDVGHVADLLAAGAGKAQGSVSDMGAALNQAGLIAASTGLTVEETTGTLAAMASAGLLGSDAGTSLKTSLVALSAPSATAAKEMERLGITAYDANGEFVGMDALAGNLESSLKNLTPAQRNAALATIFGTDALRTANVLYEQGASGIAEWTDKVNDSGYAAETARIQTDNLTGDLERLGGAFDTVLIQSGSGANDMLRGLVQGAEAAVDAFGRLPAPLLSATGLIAGGGGLALLGIAGMGKLVVGVNEARLAVGALGVSMKTAGILAGGLGGAIAIGTVAFTAWATAAAEAEARTDGYMSTLDELGNRTDTTVKRINESLSANQNDWFDNLLGDDPESLIDRAERAGLAIEDLQGYILGNEDATRKVTEATRDYIAAQGEELTTTDIRAQAGRFLTDSLDAEAGALTDAEKAAGLKARADEAAGVAAEDMAGATEGATSAVESNSEAIKENLKLIAEAAGVVLSERDAQRSLEAAFDDAKAAIKENGETLDVATGKGRANQSALDAVAAGAWDVAESMYAANAPTKAIAARMGEARDAFIRTARSAGATKAEANALADELGLIPSDVETILKARDNASGTINDVQTLLDGLRDKTVHVSVVTSATGGTSGVRFTGAGGSGVQLKAAGGSIDGGTPGKDSVPILGMPGEHMLTVSDVQAMGGHAGVYAFRAALHGGVQAMATGGEVGAAGRDVARWRRELERARAERSRAKDSERQASRTDSERDDRAAERLMNQAEKRVERAEKALDDARGRRARLLDERSDLSTSFRRGEFRDSVTGGLSGALGVTDQLRDLANSGDVDSWRARRLRNTAGGAENALTSLYNQAERVEKKLGDARERFDELQQVQAGVRSAVVGGFSLSSVVGSFDPKTGKRAATGSALAAAAKAYAGKARTFAGLLSQLGSKTSSAAIVQEVAGYGIEEGTPLAQSLLSDLPALRSLATSYRDIEKFGGWAGAAVARSVGGGQGVYEAQQAVRSAEAQAAAIDKRIGKWGKILGVEMARALGIKARASGGPYSAGDLVLTGERGPELEFKGTSGYVLTADATRRLASSSYGRAPSSTTAPIYNDNSLSVTTNRHVSPDTLLRFDRKRSLLRGRA